MKWKLEWNGGKLTVRDQKLLVLLIVVAIFAVCGWMVIRPLSIQIRENQNEIPVQEELKALNEAKIAMLSTQRRIVASNEERLRTEKEQYFPWMESDEIGKYLTNMGLSRGLRVLNLNIVMPQQPSTVTPYTGTEKASGTDGKTPVLWVAKASIELQGEIEVLQGMLDRLQDQQDSVRVTSFQWAERIHWRNRELEEAPDQVVEKELVTVKTLKIDLDLYMTKGTEE